MSNRIASSRVCCAAIVFATGLVPACGDDGRDAGSQTAAGSAAGSSGTGTAGSSKNAGADGSNASGSGGSNSAAGSGGAAGTGTGMAGSASGAAGAATPMMDDGSASWSSIYQYVFWSCRNETCHGNGLAGVDFRTKDAAWETLIDQPANPDFACAALGKPRVTPGEPDNSLLYLKLDINSPCGQQMPPGGELSDPAKARVREWIMNGAKND